MTIHPAVVFVVGTLGLGFGFVLGFKLMQWHIGRERKVTQDGVPPYLRRMLDGMAELN